MREEELLEQAQSLQIVYCDGFGAFRKVNGVLRCVGYVLQSGPCLNLAVSLAGAHQSASDLARALAERPAKCLAIWNGTDLAH